MIAFFFSETSFLFRGYFTSSGLPLSFSETPFLLRNSFFIPRTSPYLLQNSFSILRLLYILRTSPCFLSYLLRNNAQIFLISFINIHFGDFDPAWSQANLAYSIWQFGDPECCVPCSFFYIGSATASSNLLKCILPTHLQFLPISIPFGWCSLAMSPWP